MEALAEIISDFFNSIDPKRSFGSIHATCLSTLSRRPRDGSVVSCLHCMDDPQPEGHMASHIGRRKFLATLGGAAAAWPLAVRAQQGERVRRIGLLMGVADDLEGQARVTGLKQGLQELGWTDGRNIQIETRFGEADAGRIRAHAAEL